MSRSGYGDCDGDDLALGRWRGVVASAIRGKRGQAFLREMLAALDAMPIKRLVAEELVEQSGEVCAIGAVGKARGVDMSRIDPDDYDRVAATFGIAAPLAQEIVWMNDDAFSGYDYVKNPETGEYDKFPITPEIRWQKMREWVSSQIKASS